MERDKPNIRTGGHSFRQDIETLPTSELQPPKTEPNNAHCIISSLYLHCAIHPTHRIVKQPHQLRAIPRPNLHNERPPRALRSPQSFKPRLITSSESDCSTTFDLESATTAEFASNCLFTHLLTTDTYPKSNPLIEYHQSSQSVISNGIGHGDTGSRSREDQQPPQFAQIQQPRWPLYKPGGANGESAERGTDPEWI